VLKKEGQRPLHDNLPFSFRRIQFEIKSGFFIFAETNWRKNGKAKVTETGKAGSSSCREGKGIRERSQSQSGNKSIAEEAVGDIESFGGDFRYFV
jgi:hypothetical protein